MDRRGRAAKTSRPTSTLVPSWTFESRCVSCQPSFVYRRNFIVAISVASRMGSPFRTRLQEVLFSKKLRVYLRKFTQIGRTQRRCFLPVQPLAGTTHFSLSLQPNQLEGLFLLNDGVVVPIGFHLCLTTSQARGVLCFMC